MMKRSTNLGRTSSMAQETMASMRTNTMASYSNPTTALNSKGNNYQSAINKRGGQPANQGSTVVGRGLQVQHTKDQQSYGNNSQDCNMQDFLFDSMRNNNQENVFFDSDQLYGDNHSQLNPNLNQVKSAEDSQIDDLKV